MLMEIMKLFLSSYYYFFISLTFFVMFLIYIGIKIIYCGFNIHLFFGSGEGKGRRLYQIYVCSQLSLPGNKSEHCY